MKDTTVLYSLVAGALLFSLNSVYHTYKCAKYRDELREIRRGIVLESINSCSDISCINKVMSAYEELFQKHKQMIIERGCHE